MQLPWVRLHGTKDYLEMARHLQAVPAMHATINLVPSLLSQLDDYCNGAADDEILRLARRSTDSLSNEEQKIIIDQCFNANEDRMISRSPRYQELHTKSVFNSQELRDLIVHFHLAWTGEFSRAEEPFVSLIKKDSLFSEEDKQSLLDAQLNILRQIIPEHRALAANGNVELSTTPFYHPILPLLCDTDVAHEATPELQLPKKQFSSVDDANEQVVRGIAAHTGHFGSAPKGMWPAEGSISNAALAIIAANHISWAASDESVLFHSLHEEEYRYGEFEKYFPRQRAAGEDSITIFFRDHQLSDKIGFDYQSWQAGDAVMDFMNHLKYVRSEIIREYGEETLHDACITVILDGENCWEQYENNGYDFLHQLYEAISSDVDIDSVTISEAIERIGTEHIRTLDNVVGGSWIDGNFKIWIGHSEKNRAWELLADALLECSKHTSNEVGYQDARSALLQAEGSDWFWWFGDDHFSEDRELFDKLFREHLARFYDALSVNRPESLSHPIIGNQTNAKFGAMHRSRS